MDHVLKNMCLIVSHISSVDSIGDVCNEDNDKDGFLDDKDNCIHDRFKSVASFSQYFMFWGIDSLSKFDTSAKNLEGKMEITDNGRSVYFIDLKPPKSPSPSAYFFIGKDFYGPMDYYGTMFVNDEKEDGFIGFIFGYQNEQKFYVAMWRKNDFNFKERVGGIKGILIKVRHYSVCIGCYIQTIRYVSIKLILVVKHWYITSLLLQLEF